MITFVVLKENETIINKDKLSSEMSGFLDSEIIIIIIIIITIFIEEAFSLKSGLQKGPQKIKNLQYWMLKMFKKN